MRKDHSAFITNYLFSQFLLSTLSVQSTLYYLIPPDQRFALTVFLKVTFIIVSELFLKSFFTAMFYMLAVESSVHCSIFCHHKKVELIREFNEFDVLMERNLKYKVDKKMIARRSVITFVAFCMTSIIASSLFTYGCFSQPVPIFYASQLIIMSHVVHAETFQLYIFRHGIQNRFEMITNSDALRKRDAKVLQRFKECYIKLYETNEKLNNCFKTTMLLIFMQIFSAIVIYSYWFSMALLGSGMKIEGCKYLINLRIVFFNRLIEFIFQ